MSLSSRHRPFRVACRRPLILAGIAVGALLAGCQDGATPHMSAAASLAASESAIERAEASLAAADGSTTAGVSNVDSSGLLDDNSATSQVNSAASSNPTSALAALSAIPVKGRAPMTGYSRSQFGAAWADVDHNGCDTRNDVLARDLTGDTFKPGTHDCVVLTGSLADPYSGRTIAFQRGVTTSSAVQIDHVVALGDAWQTGAQGWSVTTRTAFANDLRNLLAVDGPLNEQKGDGDAATWLPPNKAYRCSYVARQVAVKATYGLWMTQAEKDASATILAGCPAMPLPDGVAVPVVAPTTTTAPAPAPVVTRAPAPAPRTTVAPAPVPAPAPQGPYYANCTAARAAGVAPLHIGQPGYRPALDRDGDGIACE